MRARELLLVVVAARVPEEHPRSYLSLAFPRNAVDVREKPPTSAFLRNAFLEKGSRGQVNSKEFKDFICHQTGEINQPATMGGVWSASTTLWESTVGGLCIGEF